MRGRHRRQIGTRSSWRAHATLSVTAALLACLACDSRAFVVLEMKDPLGLTAGATRLRFESAEGVFAEVALPEEGFPLSQTLVGRDGASRTIWVDALDDAGTNLARASATLTFDRRRTGAAEAVFGRPCELSVECDDGAFCNGAERCVDRVCRPGEDPCPPSPFACVGVACDEAADTCEVVPDHSQCAPLLDPATGEEEETYCDVRLGCVPGEGCDQEGAPCPRRSACEWNRTCVGGRCIPTSPLEVDDGNPCTVDYCEEGVGVVHAPDPFATGNTCPLPGQSGGICLDGQCVPSVCGDGYVDVAAGEACDTGPDLSDTEPNACRTDCTLPRCGDGVADAGEECDDGNTIEEDRCRSDCTWNVCGDGVLDPTAEECDDGNADDTDDCVQGCKIARCGDGFLHAGVEECDDGNTSQNDACLNDCTPNVCGDGYRNPLTEECDDGNADDTDGCVAGCKVAFCGDGFVQTGVEACDDGNDVATDACLPNCTANRCGDGILNEGVEVCDDGNTVSFDGCSADCDYVVWATSLGATIGNAALVAWQVSLDPLVYGLAIGTQDGIAHALSTVDGSVLWTYDAGAPLEATAVVGGGKVVFLSTDGRVHAVPLAGPDAQGAPAWIFTLPAPSSAIGLGRQQEGFIAVDDTGTIVGIGDDGSPKPHLNDYALATNLGPCQGCAPTIPNHNNPAHGVLVGLGGQVVVADFDRPNCPPMTLDLQPGERAVGEIAFLGDNSTGVSPRDHGWFVTTLNRLVQGSYVQPSTDCQGGRIDLDWSFASGTSNLGK